MYLDDGIHMNKYIFYGNFFIICCLVGLRIQDMINIRWKEFKSVKYDYHLEVLHDYKYSW